MNAPVLIDAATFWRKVDTFHATVDLYEGFAFAELDGAWFKTRLTSVERAA